jgi:hypothetical protein
VDRQREEKAIMSTRVYAVIVLIVFGSASAGAAADVPSVEPSATQPSAPPQEPPPPPATTVPPPPHTQPIEPPPLARSASPAAAAPSGQWVYTKQYGWVWMAYDDSYTQVVPDAALAYQFVYYPSFGWRWVVAPWVLGFGAAPFWGRLGPSHFHWYARPRYVAPHPYRGPGWGHFGGGHPGRGMGHGHR